MATNPPPQTFELGSCWPRWDNNRSALLAWTEHAQIKRFLVKEQHSKYHIVLSCAVCSRSSSRAPYAVEIEFDGVDQAEKVVSISLKHNHRLSALSPAEAATQEKEIAQRRADLFEYALNELKSIKRCGGPEKLKPSEREVGQDRVLEDVRRALGDESADNLLKTARKQGFLVGIEAEMDSRARFGFGLRPRAAQASSLPLPTPPSASLTPANSTPLPSDFRTFRTLNHLDKSLNAWAQMQGFSVRSSDSEEETIRFCSAKKTAAKCGWFIKVEVKSAKKVIVVEEYAAHSHPLEKGAGSVKAAPKDKGKGKQRERSAAVEPESIKTFHLRRSTSPPESQPQQQLWTPGLSPLHPVKRERDASPAARIRQPSPSHSRSSSTSPSPSNSNAKRFRRESSSPLSDASDDSNAASISVTAQQQPALNNDQARSTPSPFSATDLLRQYLHQLIPEDGRLGDDYVHEFETIGSRNRDFLMKMVAEDLERVMELLSTKTTLPPLTLMALETRWGGVKPN